MKKSLVAVIVIASLSALLFAGMGLYTVFTTDSSAQNAYNMMVLSTISNLLPVVLCFLFIIAGAAFALRKSMLAFLYTFLAYALCGYKAVNVYRVCKNICEAAAGTVLSDVMVNRLIMAQWIPLIYMVLLTTAFTALAAVWLTRCRREKNEASAQSIEETI